MIGPLLDFAAIAGLALVSLGMGVFLGRTWDRDDQPDAYESLDWHLDPPTQIVHPTRHDTRPLYY